MGGRCALLLLLLLPADEMKRRKEEDVDDDYDLGCVYSLLGLGLDCGRFLLLLWK